MFERGYLTVNYERITASSENPYYDYSSYMQKCNMMSDDYFNAAVQEEFKIKHDYYVSTLQLEFLKWEYEHRKYYLPSFMKRLKALRLEMIIHVSVAVIIYIVCSLMFRHMYPGFSVVLPPLYYAFFILPSAINALARIRKYCMAAGCSFTKSFASRSGYVSLYDQRIRYESELIALENDIFNLQNKVERLYELARPYIENIPHFMELENAVENEQSNEELSYSVRIKIEQNSSRRKELNQKLRVMKLHYKKFCELTGMFTILMIVSLVFFVCVSIPFFSQTITTLILVCLVLPFTIIGVNRIFDYCNSTEADRISECEAALQQLNKQLVELNAKRESLEQS